MITYLKIDDNKIELLDKEVSLDVGQTITLQDGKDSIKYLVEGIDIILQKSGNQAEAIQYITLTNER